MDVAGNAHPGGAGSGGAWWRTYGGNQEEKTDMAMHVGATEDCKESVVM